MSCSGRASLLAKMHDLSKQGIDCRACGGECCTARSNSMQITEEEGHSILRDLQSQGLLTADLLRTLRETVANYRLDVPIPSFGSRPNLRRTYTCPLFREGLCIVNRESKPYGCLAFNPVVAGATGLKSGCRSDQTTLAQSAPDGAKSPIPVMLLHLIETEGAVSP